MEPPNQALKDLALLVGDDAAKEIVQLFLHSFPDSIRSLGVSSRQDQMRITHGLKSSALHMGAERLVDQISVIDAKLAQPGEKVTQADLAPAMTEFEAFAGSLREYAGP